MQPDSTKHAAKRPVQSLKGLYSQFRATATGSGILVVALQALAFYWSLGWRGATLFVLVPLLGSLASIVRDRRAASDGPSEPRGWRNAVANVGIASALAIVLIAVTGTPARRLLVAIIVANLATTLSDTLSHELGVTFGGQPRLITSFRKVAPGTNGAVSVVGSLVAFFTAFLFPGIAALLALIRPGEIPATALSALAGNLVDSFLGATLEGRSFLNNDVVNFASVAAVTGIAFLLLH